VRCTVSVAGSAVVVPEAAPVPSVTLIAVGLEGEADPSRLVKSLRRQTDDGWELLLVGDPGGRRRFRIGRRQSTRVRQIRPPDGDVARAAAYAVSEAGGDFIGFVSGSDVLAPTAIGSIRQHSLPDVDVLYSDEDRITLQGRYADPLYKPGWSPERLRCQPYTGRLTLIRRSFVETIGGIDQAAGDAFEWDLVLQAAEVGPRAVHIPEVLYHRAQGTDRLDRGSESERRVIERHLQRTRFPGTLVRADKPSRWQLDPRLDDEPMVSIVIPTAGRTRMVRGLTTNLVVNSVTSIVERSTYSHYEIVCVAGPEVTDDVVATLSGIAGNRLRVVPNPGPFNFSRAINLGAIRARGDYLLLLNDDTEVINGDWIERLLMYGEDPGIGAVGAKLLFSDGRIQHCGIIALGRRAVGHPCYGFPGDDTGIANELALPANYLAVTGACVLTARDRFFEIGGFSPRLPLNYNDVDYCLKLHHRGERIVYNPDVCLYHFELSSRLSGEVETAEAGLLEDRWGGVLERGDPFYNPNFFPSTDFLPPVRSADDLTASTR
jgi:GT2 family glycosyltransferase